jgi:hypothetical protein
MVDIQITFFADQEEGNNREGGSFPKAQTIIDLRDSTVQEAVCFWF